MTKATFVGEGFTRKPPKYERFIRPMALRFKKAHVTHPELNSFAPLCFFPHLSSLSFHIGVFCTTAQNILLGHHWREEEPSEPDVHAAWCHHQGNHHRGQCIRPWLGHTRWQGCLGQVRAGDKQPRERWLHQRCASRIKQTAFLCAPSLFSLTSTLCCFPLSDHVLHLRPFIL